MSSNSVNSLGLGYSSSLQLQQKSGLLRNRILTVLGHPSIPPEEIRQLPPLTYVRLETIRSLYEHNRLHEVFAGRAMYSESVANHWSIGERRQLQQLIRQARKDTNADQKVQGLRAVCTIIGERFYPEVKYDREAKLMSAIRTSSREKIKLQLERGAVVDLNHLYNAVRSDVDRRDFENLVSAFSGKIDRSYDIFDLHFYRGANEERVRKINILFERCLDQGMATALLWKAVTNMWNRGLPNDLEKDKAYFSLLLDQGASPNSLRNPEITGGYSCKSLLSCIAFSKYQRRGGLDEEYGNYCNEILKLILNSPYLQKQKEIPQAMEVALQFYNQEVYDTLAEHFKPTMLFSMDKETVRFHKEYVRGSWYPLVYRDHLAYNNALTLRNRRLSIILMACDAFSRAITEGVTARWLLERVDKDLFLKSALDPRALYYRNGVLPANFLNVLRMSLEMGANPNQYFINRATGNRTSLLKYAVISKIEPLVELLLEFGARPTYDVLAQAAWQGASPAIIRLLVDAGADLKARNRNGDIALHYAAKCPTISLESFNLLSDDGKYLAVRNDRNNTPLGCVIERNDLTLFSSVVCQVMRRISEGKRTAFSSAVISSPKAAEKVQKLFELGVLQREARLWNRGFTPFHCMVLTNTLSHDEIEQVVNNFKAAGFPIDMRFSKEGNKVRRGDTPLHAAARNGNFSVQHFLLKAGANQALLDADGKTAMQLYLEQFDDNNRKRERDDKPTTTNDDEEAKKKQRAE